jgi:hypothetical protein
VKSLIAIEFIEGTQLYTASASPTVSCLQAKFLAVRI